MITHTKLWLSLAWNSVVLKTLKYNTISNLIRFNHCVMCSKFHHHRWSYQMTAITTCYSCKRWGLTARWAGVTDNRRSPSCINRHNSVININNSILWFSASTGNSFCQVMYRTWYSTIRWYATCALQLTEANLSDLTRHKTK